MQINRLETHDRYLIAKKEEDVIQKGFEECKFRNPDALELFEYSNYIYIFAHKREIGIDEKQNIFMSDLSAYLSDMSYKRKYLSMSDIPTFRILWQPRLTKPDPQTNSYLFRTLRDSPDVEVYWILPPEELWGQNKKGNMTEDPIVSESIYMYKNNREKMAQPHVDDLPYEKVKEIRMKIMRAKGSKKINPIFNEFPEFMQSS